MNTENEAQARGKLEKLTPEQQSYIVELRKRATLEDMVESLKEHGIDTSPSALSRFIRKRRGEELVETGQEIAAAAEALAEQGRGGKLREGTLEIMRQQFFEKAAGGVGGEEAQVLYGALVAEEARVKELELEARKVAALEQQVRLQEKRIEVEAMKARAALGRVKGQVVDVGMEVKEGAEPERRAIPPEGGTTCGKGGVSGGAEMAAPGNVEEGGNGWAELCGTVMGILNRGGDPGERILEARALLAEKMRSGGGGE